MRRPALPVAFTAGQLLEVARLSPAWACMERVLRSSGELDHSLSASPGGSAASAAASGGGLTAPAARDEERLVRVVHGVLHALVAGGAVFSHSQAMAEEDADSRGSGDAAPAQSAGGAAGCGHVRAAAPSKRLTITASNAPLGTAPSAAATSGWVGRDAPRRRDDGRTTTTTSEQFCAVSDTHTVGPALLAVMRAAPPGRAAAPVASRVAAGSSSGGEAAPISARGRTTLRSKICSRYGVGWSRDGSLLPASGPTVTTRESSLRHWQLHVSLFVRGPYHHWVLLLSRSFRRTDLKTNKTKTSFPIFKK
jgi:hypothetical protein